jgi:hypothetical protein
VAAPRARQQAPVVATPRARQQAPMVAAPRARQQAPVVSAPRARQQAPVVSALLGLSVAAAACTADGPTAATAVDPQLHALQAEMFTVSCALSESCHAGPTPKEGLDLRTSVWSRIVNRPSTQVPDRHLIVPGAPEASYLFEKVSRPTPTKGVRMPNAGPPLEAPTLTALRTWILQGAQNN